MAFNRTMSYSDAIFVDWGFSTADSRSRVARPYVIVNTNQTNPEIIPLLKNESRCRYCTTLAFYGERQCVACGAPL